VQAAQVHEQHLGSTRFALGELAVELLDAREIELTRQHHHGHVVLIASLDAQVRHLR
jgi:hypothetical protein